MDLREYISSPNGTPYKLRGSRPDQSPTSQAVVTLSLIPFLECSPGCLRMPLQTELRGLRFTSSAVRPSQCMAQTLCAPDLLQNRSLQCVQPHAVSQLSEFLTTCAIIQLLCSAGDVGAGPWRVREQAGEGDQPPGYRAHKREAEEVRGLPPAVLKG